MTSTSSTTAAKPTKKGAVKGAAAAAAGLVVLMGGAGSFALWNANGAIGEGSTTTGSLSADFGDTTWQDTTPGASNTIDDIESFKMVPGDTIEGTTPIKVTATGENLLVDASLDTTDAALPDGVTASVELSDGTTTGDTLELQGTNEGAVVDLTADVTLAFDEGAESSMTAPIDLSKINVDLEQVLPGTDTGA